MAFSHALFSSYRALIHADYDKHLNEQVLMFNGLTQLLVVCIFVGDHHDYLVALTTSVQHFKGLHYATVEVSTTTSSTLFTQ